MARPSVNIFLSNGGLGLIGPSDNGTCVILVACPVAPVAGYDVPFLIKSVEQAETAFAQVGNEAVLDAIVNGFFAEAAQGTKVYFLAMVQATLLADLVDSDNADKALNMAAGAARLVAAIKFPDTEDEDYELVVLSGLDTDVHSAVTAAQTLSTAWFNKKQPFRYFIDGFGYTGVPGNLKDYNTTTNRNGHIVLGTIDGSSQKATLMALGRASKAEPQQNIGRIKSGSLAIAEMSEVLIGATEVEQMSDANLDTIWEKRYITFEKNKIASGYVFSDDNSLTELTDDYNNLRYGRVIDNATRVAFQTYYRELKEDVEVDENGRLDTVVEKALQTAVETNIDFAMRGQLSKANDGTADVQCLVNPDATTYAPLYEQNGITAPNFNILQTGQVYLFLQLRPKGCLKYLNVYLGFTS